jgi:hypothetical protein
MGTKFSPEEIINLIEEFITAKGLNPLSVEIGSLSQTRLATILHSKNITNKCQIFDCEINNIDIVIKYFIEKGLIKSSFSENIYPFIFLLY